MQVLTVVLTDEMSPDGKKFEQVRDIIDVNLRENFLIVTHKVTIGGRTYEDTIAYAAKRVDEFWIKKVKE